MGQPPDRDDYNRNAWGQEPPPRGWRPESRPLRVARTVRDMFTRGPRRRPAGEGAGPSGAPVPATPSWLNSPPPPHTTVAGMERGGATGRSAGGQPPRYAAQPPRQDWNPARGGPTGGRQGGPFGPPDQGGAPPQQPPPGAGPRWQPPEWLPASPPSDGYPLDRSGYGGQGGRPGGIDGFDAPFGSSGEYGPYGPTPQGPYGQSAPEYVPPLTTKTPAAGGAWSGGYAPPQNYGRAPASLAHGQLSSSTVTAGEYVPGGSGAPLWEQAPAPAFTADASKPYYWEEAARPPSVPLWATAARWALILALLLVAFMSSAYAGVSAYTASQLIYVPQVAPVGSPADFKMDYKSVQFPSRIDKKAGVNVPVGLEGWFIPGIDTNGKETDARTIIVVHGTRANRTDPGVNLLKLSVALAKSGFAVLAFDMRGAGLSQAAPLSMGLYEQYDVLGAVDFLQTGTLPYPKLGRPKAIGGWGVSMGAATLLLAAAKEPAIRAVVADSSYSDILPILEREVPKRSGLPSWFTPGVLKAVDVMYGIDFSQVHPISVVASIAPRPIFFIQGEKDTYVPFSDLNALATTAQQGSGAQVTTWSVPNADHAQSYKVAGQEYVSRVTAFFTANLPVA